METTCPPNQTEAVFLRGHSFLQQGNEWIDVDVPKFANARRVRIQFDSPEFFALLRKYPRALPWVLTTRNVQLLFGETVYEIYE